MKARTKIQKKITALSKALPKITAEQKADAMKMHKAYTMVTYKHINYCLECGHKWRADNAPVRKTKRSVCPKCSEKLILTGNSNGSGFYDTLGHRDTKFYGIITVHEGWQVTRICISERYMRKKEKPRRWFKEVMQVWMDDKGNTQIISSQVANLMGYEHRWGESPLEFRGGVSFAHQWKWNHCPNRVWHKRKVIPILRRNGFTGSCHGAIPHQMMQALIQDNMVETLWKMKRYGFAEAMVYDQLGDKYWGSMRIMFKNNYNLPFDQISIWKDYVDLLEYFAKDTRSPKYICPGNLKKEHDRLVKKKKRLIKAEKLELQKARIALDEVGYEEYFKKYFDLTFKKGELVIEPLRSVQEFYDYGDKFHHCLGANSYHKDPKYLCFVAMVGGEAVENVQISLKTFKVLQSRGLQNKPSKHNAKIVKMVEDNMGKIMKAQSA